jgi:protein-tyrosine phosphatase
VKFGAGLEKTLRAMRFGPVKVAEVEDSGMDMTWVTGRIAVGGGIWNAENMAAVARAGVTHIIDMQIEFDDTALAEPYGIEVLWNPVDDDFQPKKVEVFRRGVEFAIEALDQPGTRLYIHCAAGVHRAPMMALALLGALGWKLKDAMRLIETRRPQADFADVYVRSVERFLPEYERTRGRE